MSNRDGKHDKRPYKKGKKCPKCNGTLESASKRRNPKKHQRNYVVCHGCNFTNF